MEIKSSITFQGRGDCRSRVGGLFHILSVIISIALFVTRRSCKWFDRNETMSGQWTNSFSFFFSFSTLFSTSSVGLPFQIIWFDSYKSEKNKLWRNSSTRPGSRCQVSDHACETKIAAVYKH